MKKYLFHVLLLFAVHPLASQTIYEGEVILPGQKLMSRITIENSEVFLSVPAQGLEKLIADESKITQDSVVASWKALNAHYRSVKKGDELIGTLLQHGFTFDLNMKQVKTATFVGKQQEPIPPFEYEQERVKIWNEIDSIYLAGTLSYPKDNNERQFPVAIMITGSGPQNRDELIMGHKPFLVIADHLTKNGIAVLRMDDRGVAESEGNFTTATSKDFKKDIQAGFDFLVTHRKINADQIGLIGHSEGGMVGPMVAAENENISFLVMLAGPGVSGAEVLIDQNKVIFSKSGLARDGLTAFEEHFSKIIYSRLNAKDMISYEDKVKMEVDQLFEKLKQGQKIFFLDDPEKYSAGLMDFLKTDWAYGFLAFEPSEYLARVKCPILALNGELDVQVTPKINLQGISNILKASQHKDFTIKEYPKLNHLFQTATTGMIAEYGPNEETFNMEVLKDIATWINERVN